MKLESITDLYFVISFFVPGFIYNGVLRQFIPLHESNVKETILLRLFTATAFNYAVCSPILYLVIYREDLLSQQWRAVGWIFVVFCAPIIIAVVRAKFIQNPHRHVLYKLLGLRVIDPIPTGWDWVFSHITERFILITLKDGTEIAGLLGKNSFISSDPDRKDIFMEKVYTVPKDGSAWAEVQGNLGMLIEGSQIAYIEFKG